MLGVTLLGLLAFLDPMLDILMIFFFSEIYAHNERDTRCFDHEFVFPDDHWIHWLVAKHNKVCLL